MSARSPAPLVEFKAARAGYEQPIVGPISFAVSPGRIVGLCGPNGCGKSTVLRTLTGGARLHGGLIERSPGLVVSHQQQGGPPLDELPLNGYELLSLTGATPEGLPAWLAPRLGARIGHLSGGQLQFLRLWACLTAPADLVLLDEPTNNLDREGIAFLERSLMALERERGVIVVSHDRAFVAAVCHEVIELKR